MNEEILAMAPKVELHCHVDGSVSAATMQVIMQRSGLSKPDLKTLQSQLSASGHPGSLAKYLAAFRLPNQYLVTLDAIKLAILDVARQAAHEHVIYAELRFSPQVFAQGNLSMRECVSAAVDAKIAAEAKFPIHLGLLLCAMHGRSRADNLQVEQLAVAFKDQGVVGLDLAGDEARDSMSEYRYLFTQARQDGLQYTIHAGETGVAENVLTALSFGASRIGHGIAAVKDSGVLSGVSYYHPLFELCPTSNFQTGAAKSWAEYPIPLFDQYDICWNLNTDNRTVSQTTLTKEWENAAQHCSAVTIARMHEATIDAIRYSFASQELKVEMTEEVNRWYESC